MKIDLSTIDRTQFIVSEHVIADETCYLVNPQHVGCKWTPDNLHLRSSLWNSKGELISASFPKFFNWDEAPDITPKPASLENVNFIDKIDGSTLIVSKYKGQLIVRTRGTVDATKLDNGHEIAVLMQRYPKAFEMGEMVYDEKYALPYSLIFEWVSPNNKIVLDYGTEPDIYLIGAIVHANYGFLSQQNLDILAAHMEVKRPQRYTFDTIFQMLSAVSALEGKEGVCVYYNNDQNIRKVKSVKYLSLHRFKERVTLPNLLDLFFEYDCPDKDTFYELIEQNFDYECLQMARDLVDRITIAHRHVLKNYYLLELDIAPLRELTRREAAEKILKTYAPIWQSSAFNILSNKPLDHKTLRKLMEDYPI